MGKPPLLNELLKLVSRRFDSVPDHRAGSNLTYSLRDAGLSAFAVFFMQSPSFLAHQRDMQRQRGQNNAASLFGVKAVPSDPQIRNLLDAIAPVQLQAPFWEIFDLLKEGGELVRYQDFADNWLCEGDGTQYFASTKLHCDRCSISVHNDIEHDAPTAITPVLVAPDEPRVIT